MCFCCLEWSSLNVKCSSLVSAGSTDVAVGCVRFCDCLHCPHAQLVSMILGCYPSKECMLVACAPLAVPASVWGMSKRLLYGHSCSALAQLAEPSLASCHVADAVTVATACLQGVWALLLGVIDRSVPEAMPKPSANLYHLYCSAGFVADMSDTRAGGMFSRHSSAASTPCLNQLLHNTRTWTVAAHTLCPCWRVGVY